MTILKKKKIRNFRLGWTVYGGAIPQKWRPLEFEDMTMKVVNIT